MIAHPFPPLYDADSRILILGSFPSVKSRDGRFFYHHPQNRFWKTVSGVLGCPCPETIPEKEAMLHAHHIALWDVIASCDITGSSDSSIQNVTPNDLSPIFAGANLRAIFCNGGTSYNLFCKYHPELTAVKLPSTSPANAAWTLPRLLDAWQCIRPFLE